MAAVRAQVLPMSAVSIGAARLLCVAVSSQPAHVYAGLNVQAIDRSTSNDGVSSREYETKTRKLKKSFSPAYKLDANRLASSAACVTARSDSGPHSEILGPGYPALTYEGYGMGVSRQLTFLPPPQEQTPQA